MRETWLEAFLMDFGFGPDERLGGFVIVLDEGIDVGLEFINGLERCAVEGFAGEDREPDFDLVQPRRMGRRVVEMHILVTGQPHVALRLMRREIVEYHVELLVFIGSCDLVHEGEEFDAAATPGMTADDLAGGDVEGGEQRGRSVPLIVVRLAGERGSVRQLEIALGALQGLDRRLLIDGKHDRVLGRRHGEADNLGRFRHKIGVIAFAPRPERLIF